MQENNGQVSVSEVYDSRPPLWLPKIHASGDLGKEQFILPLVFNTSHRFFLGYPGFHPPRPGQDEDVLSEANIKNGFTIGYSIPVCLNSEGIDRDSDEDKAETFSAQDTIHNRFIAGDALPELENLMNQVFARRAEQLNPIPCVPYKNHSTNDRL
jgi:mediator of RNA polymerase II transcription subunit 12